MVLNPTSWYAIPIYISGFAFYFATAFKLATDSEFRHNYLKDFLIFMFVFAFGLAIALYIAFNL